MRIIFTAKNAYSATSMAANFVLPLIAIVYLTRNLGVDTFGELVIAQAISIILSQFVDFGFILTGSREIASNGTSKRKINAIYSKYQNARMALLLFSFLILMLLAILQIIPVSYKLLYITAIPTIIGIYLQANWFFQGSQMYGWIAVASVISKFTYLALTMLLVKEKSDLLLAGVCFGTGNLVCGIILQIIIIKKNVQWSIQTNFFEITSTIKSGANAFFSVALLAVHTQFFVVMTGTLVNSGAAGALVAADKIVRGIGGLVSPIGLTNTPLLSKLFITNVNDAIILRNKISSILITYSLLCGALILTFSELIAMHLFHTSDLFFINCMNLACVIPIFTSIGLINGGLTLIPAGYDSDYLKAIFFAEILAFICFFIILIISEAYSGIGAVILAELTLAIFMYLAAKKRLKQLC